MDRMTSLSEAIRTLVETEFSGYLKINFSQGSLGRVEKCEEFNDTGIIMAGEKNDEKKIPLQKAVPIIFFFLTALASCTTSGNNLSMRSGDVSIHQCPVLPNLSISLNLISQAECKTERLL
jgi:hypothetical protein